MRSDEETSRRHVSLSQYAWEYHGITDLNMTQAIHMRNDAWIGEHSKKTRSKHDRTTPLLMPRDWAKIWAKHYSKERVKT